MLMHVNLQPAHLALLFNGSIYSVTSKKVDIGTPFNNLKLVLIKKSIPCLFIHLESPSDNLNVAEVLSTVFGKFRPLNLTGETCLHSIKESLEKIYDCKLDARLVFDLVRYFQANKMIYKIESLNIPEGKFTLKSYSIEDVNEQIKKLLFG